MFPAITGAATVSALVLAAAIADLRARRIPNVLNGCGLIAAIAWLALADPGVIPGRFLASGAIALPLAALSLKSPDAFGMGDVKLIAVLALFLGWSVLPLVLVPAMAAAASFGLLAALWRGVGPGSVSLPLAPFLALPTLGWAAVTLQL